VSSFLPSSTRPKIIEIVQELLSQRDFEIRAQKKRLKELEMTAVIGVFYIQHIHQ
jgi:hypothetical protein